MWVVKEMVAGTTAPLALPNLPQPRQGSLSRQEEAGGHLLSPSLPYVPAWLSPQVGLGLLVVLTLLERKPSADV